MADRFYGLNRGDGEFVEVTEQATTPAKDVEVAVDLAKNLTRAEVIMLLDQIKNHIMEGNWPPA